MPAQVREDKTPSIKFRRRNFLRDSCLYEQCGALSRLRAYPLKNTLKSRCQNAFLHEHTILPATTRPRNSRCVCAAPNVLYLEERLAPWPNDLLQPPRSKTDLPHQLPSCKYVFTSPHESTSSRRPMKVRLHVAP